MVAYALKVLHEPIPDLVREALYQKFRSDGRDKPNQFLFIDLDDLYAEFNRKGSVKFCSDYGIKSAREFSTQLEDYFIQF